MCDCECGDEGVSPTRRESAYDMMRVEAAVTLVLSQAQPLEAARVEAHEAHNLVLAEAVRSVEPLPPFRASIMDGYAVVAADGVGTFPVVERIAAGDMPACALQSGQVAYITTGSPVPEGADAVVKIEDTSSVEGSESVESEVAVNILKSVKAGQNIRAIGSDISPGEVLVDAHELVSAAEIGLLATAGVTDVIAHRKPVVGVLSTGSELVEAFEGENDTRQDSRQQPPDVVGADQWALQKVDVLITSGGVSMGDHDLIKPLLEEMGTVHFGRLLMKPGKPTTFATLDIEGKKKLVFALPGNPVSSFTTCHLLVHPALRRLRGFPLPKCQHVKVYATLTHPIKLDAERPEFHRANLAWDGKQHKFLATSTGRQISSRLLSCRNANALLSLPTGTEIRDGDAVAALVLDSSFENATGLAATAPTQSENAASASHQHEKEKANAPKKVFRAGLLTISDRVSAGTSTDMSGPAMADVLHQVDKVQLDVVVRKVVPDDVGQIQAVVKEWADLDVVDLILTSGGTGFSPRDVTPEAIKAVLDKEIPGFPIAMLESSLKITAKAVLSRPVAGIRKHTLIVTLPGKPKAVVENFSAIAEVLSHALHLVRDVPHEHHRANPGSLYT
ncbi:Molybdopterin biosynthesis protein CNX1 [Phytophthora ramorum]|uniref:Molybdopterin biosynthesis protein CNX1 n=1 Tax=Phytophthora ramorum TaxID=164328 RepID=UPI00309788E2|nr:Molybdopterin biosynthesis protein CNX1 [Phytophthora ramorum]